MEQCVGALEAAIRIMPGSKKAFLETSGRAEMLTIVAGMKQVLDRIAVGDAWPAEDVQLVRRLVAEPGVFFGGTPLSASALQTDMHSPYGDFAPDSVQIVGILKEMYDSFARELEKKNAEESTANRQFGELIDTKKSEMRALQATLGRQTVDQAEKAKTRAESVSLRKDTEVEYSSDKDFFAETKSNCQAKAQDWSHRSFLRTQELLGVKQAMSILTDSVKMKVVEDALANRKRIKKVAPAPKLLQLRQQASGLAHRRTARSRAYAQLSLLAQSTHSESVAQVALALSLGKQFAEVVAAIDAMVADLRQEGKEDIEHRDRCEANMRENEMARQDAQTIIDQEGEKVFSLKKEKGDLRKELATAEAKVASTDQSLKELLARRNQAVAAAKQTMQDDKEAIEVMSEVIKTLTAFYKKNKIPLSFIQADGPDPADDDEPEYTEDPDKAPEDSWSGDAYGGKKGESQNIITLLQLLRANLENEFETSREEEQKAQAAYQRAKASLDRTRKAQTAVKLKVEKERGELQELLVERGEVHTDAQQSLKEANKMKTSLWDDCVWVEKTFDVRVKSREAEIKGLISAKGYLAGMED